LNEPAKSALDQPAATAVPIVPVAGPGEDTGATPFPRARALASAGVALALLLAVALALAWYRKHTAPARWAKEVALPEATRLVNAGNYSAAFPYLYRAQQILPRDPALNTIRREISLPTSIVTSPSGADVYAKPYSSPDSEWILIGQSPIKDLLLPLGYYRWKITKPGFRTVEGGAGYQSPTFEFILDREGSGPSDMSYPTGRCPICSS